jgi:hypothetical protein
MLLARERAGAALRNRLHIYIVTRRSRRRMITQASREAARAEMAVQYRITDSIAYIGAASYPIAAISSLRVVAKRRPSIGLGLIAGGGFVLKSAFENDFGAGWWIAGGLLLSTGIGCLLPEYILYIHTAGGEVAVLKSRNRADVDKIRADIEARIETLAGEA